MSDNIFGNSSAMYTSEIFMSQEVSRASGVILTLEHDRQPSTETRPGNCSDFKKYTSLNIYFLLTLRVVLTSQPVWKVRLIGG